MGCKQSKDTVATEAVVEQGPETPAADSPEPAVRKEGTHCKVKVTIIGARGLSTFEGSSRHEPYCLVEVSGKPMSRRKTPIHSDHVNPHWNHTDEVNYYRAGDTLLFTVKDKDVLMDDMLGVCILDADDVRAGFVGELLLSRAGKGAEAYLEVDVEGVNPTAVEQAALAAVRAARQVKAVFVAAPAKPVEKEVKVNEPVEKEVKVNDPDQGSCVVC